MAYINDRVTDYASVVRRDANTGRPVVQFGSVIITFNSDSEARRLVADLAALVASS